MVARLATLILCLWSAGVQQVDAIVGDEVPPPYPIIDVHVPEPNTGTMEAKWAADDSGITTQKLDALLNKLEAGETQFRDSAAQLTEKLEKLASVAKTVVIASSQDLPSM